MLADGDRRRSQADPATAAIFLNQGQPYGRRRPARAEGPRARRCGRSREAGRRRLLQGAGGATRSSPRAAPASGIITQADLDHYTTRELAPVECDYRGYHIVSAPPPSSGGVDPLRDPQRPRGLSAQGPGLPLGAGGARADRGDAPRLRRSQQLPRRSRLRRRTRSTACSTRPTPRRSAPPSTRRRPAMSQRPEARHRRRTKAATRRTTRSSTSKGNAVAVTYTLNDWFGAKVTAAGTGVLLNNEMDDFTAKPGVPNLYGLVQGEANAIAPGKRPLELDEPDDRRQGRQAVDGGRHAGRQPHHHRGAAHDHQRHRLRHERAGSGRRAALPPAVAARTRPTSRPSRSAPTRARSSRAWATCSRRRSRPTTSRRSWSARRSLGGKPVGKNRFYGANDPRRNSGLALGY